MEREGGGEEGRKGERQNVQTDVLRLDLFDLFYCVHTSITIMRSTQLTRERPRYGAVLSLGVEGLCSEAGCESPAPSQTLWDHAPEASAAVKDRTW